MTVNRRRVGADARSIRARMVSWRVSPVPAGTDVLPGEGHGSDMPALYDENLCGRCWRPGRNGGFFEARNGWQGTLSRTVRRHDY